MQEMQPDFLGHVTKSVATLLNTILREDGLQLFRRNPQVVLGNADGIASNDFSLTFTATTTAENDKGSFSCKTSEDRFLVFRSPSRLTLNFMLSAKGLPPAMQVKSYDKLVGYFFDHRAIDPFVPESLKRFAPIYDKLMAGKAELKANEIGTTSASDLFQFGFSYLALYHSGNPLREEVKARTRVVDLANETSERSVP